MDAIGMQAGPEQGTMPDPRLDRQLRISGWDQQALEEARVAVFGDDDLLASLYVLSAAALGLNTIVLIAPRWDEGLLETARRVNPKLRLSIVEGFYTHPILDEIFRPCTAIVDLTHYALANKLLLEKGFRSDLPVIRGFCHQQNGEEGLKIFVYRRGREWQELREMVSPSNLPGDHFDDGVLDIVAAGIVLEETKNVAMGHRVSEDVIVYRRPRVMAAGYDARVCVVGAGALGNFVGLGLAFAGVRSIAVIDPDVVDVTNLNRQVFLADGVGCTKAEVLCERLRRLFGIQADARVAYFRRDTPISGYDAVFDCVDNFETRIVLSEKCRDEGKVLISGGTGPEAGQVVVYDPARGNGTPAGVLGLYDVVDRRRIETYERKSAACAYRPEPSVIMVNQVIAGFMVEAYRMLVNGQKPRNIFYHSRSDKRW
jgi:molybdopterin/thiamine biosynthesis adenylyltransferase